MTWVETAREAVSFLNAICSKRETVSARVRSRFVEYPTTGKGWEEALAHFFLGFAQSPDPSNGGVRNHPIRDFRFEMPHLNAFRDLPETIRLIQAARDVCGKA